MSIRKMALLSDPIGLDDYEDHLKHILALFGI